MNKVYNNNNILAVQLSDNIFCQKTDKSVVILNPSEYYMSLLAMCYQTGK